jgi:chemotaxis signal transduction protein
VSGFAADASLDERLLTFEIGESLYALPISGVVEVAEVEQGIAAVPTLPSQTGGVINFHGDALPVLRAGALLGVESGELEPPVQIVVVTDGPAEKALLGLPVNDVLGLVNGTRAMARGADPVAERRSIDGRVASILDPSRLVARAAAVIEHARGGTD